MNYMGPEALNSVLRVRYLRELAAEPSIPKQADATSRRPFLMVRRQGLAKERAQNIEMRLWGSCLHIKDVSWANKPVLVVCAANLRVPKLGRFLF